MQYKVEVAHEKSDSNLKRSTKHMPSADFYTD